MKKIASAIDIANTTYHNGYKGMQERKLLKLRVERTALGFRKREMDFILQSNTQMAKLLGFRNSAELDKLTGNPYVTLKILLSVYRRVRTLAEYVNKGKASFTEGEVEVPEPPRRARRQSHAKLGTRAQR